MENLLHTPPNLVPDDRFADLLRNGKPEARTPMLLRESVDRKQLPPIRRTLTINPVELGGVGDPRSGAASQSSDSESLAATPATIRHNPATADRTHPLAEPVRLCPLATVRLISPLHFRSSGIISNLQTAREYIQATPNHPVEDAETQRNPYMETSRPLSRKAPQNKVLFGRSSLRFVVRGRRIWVGETISSGDGVGLIHSLWINLWIKISMCCKAAFFRLGI
jgi:hypothetical protein